MDQISKDLAFRYGEEDDVNTLPNPTALVESMIARGSCREFTDKDVDPQIIRLLCAAALAAPTKSDLQQRDIIVVRNPAAKKELLGLLDTEGWLNATPTLIVFCGNHRRQRMLHDMHQIEFANDHLDAFFNAAVDAGIALSAFVTAAEAMGLGCCPISAVRNEAEAVSQLLNLSDFVFPVAGLALGHPASESKISPRLPLTVTVHEDRFQDNNTAEAIQSYDKRRETLQPYSTQRATATFGEIENYGWSLDKARQYSFPERQAFGEFIKARGFKLR